jgi:hypothetical protein
MRCGRSLWAFVSVCVAVPSVNVLVVFTSDGYDATKSVALAIAAGANSTAGAAVRCRSVVETNYDVDIKVLMLALICC